MKVHVDIGHAAHVHLFKNFARTMKNKGHSVHFTVRVRENVVSLMEREGFEFRKLGRHYISPVGKLWGLLKYNLMLLVISLRERPDFFLSHGSLYTLFSSFLLRIPNVSLEDTGNSEQVSLYRHFTKAILTAESFRDDYGRKQIRYSGCHELAYLHPHYFTPDPGVIAELGLENIEKYFIVRFVSWHASHDIKLSGIEQITKRKIVQVLQTYGRVFVSSEKDLPDDMTPYRFPLPPDRIHHALAFATLYVGEGATMASEAAILGTTAIYINPLEAGSIDEQEKAGLVHHFRSEKGVIEKITTLLSDPSIKEDAIIKSMAYKEGKIDLTAFLVKFVSDWPGSTKVNKT